MRPALAALLALAAAPAVACDGETILSCTAKGGTKAIEIWLEAATLTYAYGPAGQPPELTLREPLTDGTLYPWQGFGRAIAESIAFLIGPFRYDVAYSVDRLDDNHPAKGSVTVTKHGVQVASIPCDPGSVTLALIAAQDAMAALGLCWDGPTESWTQTCP